MSLINDALNKARDDEAAKSSPNASRARRDDSVPAQGRLVALALVMGGVIIVLLAVIIVALLQLFKKPAPAVAETAAPVGQVAKVENPAPESAQAKSPELTLAAQIAAAQKNEEKKEDEILHAFPTEAPKAPAAPVATASPSLPATQTVSAPASEPVPAVAAPVEPAPAPEPPAPKIVGPDPRIAEFVQGVQVRGLGLSKVLLLVPGAAEAAAYAEGDEIDCPYELKLVSLNPRKLVFEDANGQKYPKPLY